jgi:DNA-binding CsgD family transcriptional regulator/tetratricopeptide (TPR) repeat protein
MVTRAGTGRAAIGFVEGEAGIGKSRLLGEVARIADERGLQVFTGAASELDRNWPFGPLIDAFAITPGSPDELRAQVGRLLAGEVPNEGTPHVGRGPGAQYQVLVAFLDLIEREAGRGPTLVLLEDLHWAEASTLLVIRSFAKRLGGLPVVLLGSFRPSPRLPELERLVAELLFEGAIHLVLEPLPPETVTRLVEHLISARPGQALLAAAARAGGNPLYVIELVTGLQAEGIIYTDGTTAEASEVSLPPTIATTILRRLNLVADQTAEILRIAAVLGSSFSLTDVSLVSGRPAAALLAPFDEAMQAGVIGEAGTRLGFRHDLIRDAIYESMPIAIRTALHQEAGHALAAAGAPALRVAQHLALGASAGDEQAAAWLWRAGRETMATAPAVGVRLLERALDVAGHRHSDEDAMLADLVVARVWCGRAAEAATLARDILQRRGGGSAIERVRFGLVQSLWILGRWEEALDVARERCAAPDVSEEERARLLAETTLGQLFVSGCGPAIAQCEEALEIGRRIGDDLVAVAALHGLATCLYFDARYERAVAAAEEAVRIAESSPSDEPRHLHPHFTLAQAYIGADRLEDAERVHRAGRAMGERIGSAWDSGWYVAGLASRRFFAGDWDDAIAEAEAALALADEIGTDLGRVYVASMLALMLVHRDELIPAERAVGAAMAAAQATGPAIGHDWMPWAHALVMEAQGDVPGAFAVLRDAYASLESIGMATSLLRFGPDLVRLALAMSDRDTAVGLTSYCERAAARTAVATVEGVALRCRGLIDDDPDSLLRAVAAFRRSPRRVERALAMEDTAGSLAQHGRAAEAVPLYEEALELYGGAGATRDEARAASALRGLGIKRGVRGTRKRPATGWDALTKTELEVVRLVAEGLSNPGIGARLFISRHTVETHVRHVFEKLGVGSRAEVAAAATRHLSKS